MSDGSENTQKTYHKKATGAALATIKKHIKDHELKLYGSCFWYESVFFAPIVTFLEPTIHHAKISGTNHDISLPAPLFNEYG